MASVTVVERWGDAGEGFAARLPELTAAYGEPTKTEDQYALWEAEGYDVVLEVDRIFSGGEKVSVVLIRYLRNET